jgi:energy-coupling factor transporter transmembrane protein EcfT
MNKKSNTVLFTIVSTIVNILMTLLIIIALCLIAVVILNKIFKITNGAVYQVVLMICFLGGMVLSMFLFVKLTGWVIKKFHMESKLDAHLLGRYGATQTEEKKDDKPKTVLPNSVLRKKDTWGEQDVNASEAAEETPEAPAPEKSLDETEVYPPVEQYPPTLDNSKK